MNTQQLECFIHVADKLNFTKAAEELYLSTPTVTHHIKSLEEELGAQLFYRTSKMVQLTEIGNIFYSDANDILSRIDLSHKKISKTLSQTLSYLRIGCSSFIELESLEPVLTDIHKEFPDTYPLILVKDYFKLRTMFESNHLEAVLATKEMLGDIDCTFKKIKDMKSYAVFPEKPEFSQFADAESLSFKDLETERLITLNPKLIPFQPGNSAQTFLTLNSQTNLHIMCESEQVNLLMAKSGYGISILPEFCIPKEHEGLCIRVIKDQIPIEYGIAYRKKQKEKYVKFFIDNFQL